MLPFHVSRIFNARFEAFGLIRARGDGLHLAFQEPGEDYEVFLENEEIDSLFVPWDTVTSARSKHGFLESRLTLMLEDSPALAGLPGVTKRKGELRLRVLKDDRKRLDAFMSDVEGYRSGRKTDVDVDDVLDDVTDFLERY